jgi:hypothetical protein
MAHGGFRSRRQSIAGGGGKLGAEFLGVFLKDGERGKGGRGHGKKNQNHEIRNPNSKALGML